MLIPSISLICSTVTTSGNSLNKDIYGSLVFPIIYPLLTFFDYGQYGRLGSSTGLAPLPFLWVAVSYGCIIIPISGSWRRQFPPCRQRVTEKLARPFGVVAYQSAGSPYIERVRLPYTASDAFFVKEQGLCQPAKAHRDDMLLWNGKRKRPRRGSGKGVLLPLCGRFLRLP